MPYIPGTSDFSATLVALPGRLFFTESVACPDTLSPEQADDLARLTVESRSPFPEEKLAVCHRLFPAPGKLAVFATLKERLAPFIPAGTTPAHVIPDAALPLPAGKDGWRWIDTGNALTAVRYEQGAPVEVRGFAHPESHDDAVVLASRINAAKRAGIPETGPVWRLTDATPSRKPAGLSLHWREVGAAAVPADHGRGTLTTFLGNEDLDSADVRPAAVVATLRKYAANGHKLALAFKGLASVAALLVLAQIALWSVNAVAAHREATLDDNRPRAEAVEAKAALLDTLGKVTDRRAPQLEWMAALNEVRPDSVWLRRIAADDKGLIASGNARSMEALNGWLSALRKSKDFTEVTAPRITTAGQVVSFDLRVTAAKSRIQNKDTAR